jgi:hypothetical protein
MWGIAVARASGARENYGGIDVRIIRDGKVVVGTFELSLTDDRPGFTTLYVPGGYVNSDIPPPGAHAYWLQLKPVGGLAKVNLNFDLGYDRIFAYEVK